VIKLDSRALKTLFTSSIPLSTIRLLENSPFQPFAVNHSLFQEFAVSTIRFSIILSFDHTAFQPFALSTIRYFNQETHKLHNKNIPEK